MSNQLNENTTISHNLSRFADGVTGACLCGSVRVTIHDKELFTKPRGHLCHCSNCRKVSGSFVAPNLLIESEKVEIQDTLATLKTYVDHETSSGKPVMRSFCGKDGCPVKSESENLPGKVIVKLGIFPQIPVPEMEAFVLHKQPWESSIEGTVKYKLVRGGEVMEG